MRATCHANLVPPELITVMREVKCRSYEAPHCAVFSNLLPLPLRPRYSPQHPVLSQNHTGLKIDAGTCTDTGIVAGSDGHDDSGNSIPLRLHAHTT